MKPSKKLFIKTYGCQMNIYDSQRMTDVLAPFGYGLTDGPEDADLVLLNTCHIREKASEKVYSELGRIKKKIREKQTPTIIGVAGCVAQAEGKEIISRAPFVDMVIGPQTYHQLPEMLAKIHRDRGEKLVNIDFPVDTKFDYLPQERAQPSASAFISIQEGCDKFCSFCVVPYTRGAEYSRPASAIIDEAKQLLKTGVKEITLLGQNVNAFHGDGPDGKNWGLGRLLYALAELDGLVRLRYMTSHPKDMDEELYHAHRDIPQLMRYLHLPVQSGSDAILKTMNRKHTAADYYAIIDRLRSYQPEMALSSDFIVGFPGETDRDFEKTMDLVRKIGFAQAFSFKYSPRPGTPAASDPKQIPEDVKTERLEQLQALLTEQQTAFNKKMLNQEVEILLEKPGKKEGQFIGKTEFMQSVYVNTNPRLVGQMINVKITKATQNGLTGDIVTMERSSHS